MNELARFGKFENLADLFGYVERQTEIYATTQFPDDKDYYSRQELRNKLEAEFLMVLKSYAVWSKPTGWMLDWCEPSGSFGILLTGEYTCLVCLHNDGKVGGHS